MQIPRNFGFVRPLNDKKFVEYTVEKLRTIHELWTNNKWTEEQTTETTVQFVKMLRKLSKRRLTMIWNKCFDEKTPLMT